MSVVTVKTVISGKPMWMVVALLVAYTVLHFAFSGVRYPLQQPNIGQIQQELPPLTAYLATSTPLEMTNVRQYGPVFFFVMQPLLRVTGGDTVALSRWLYVVQLTAIAVAFLCCLLSLRVWLGQTRGADAGRRFPTAHVALFLAVLWLNFSPLYYILAVKNVEMWELCLLSVALFSYVRGWRFAAAFCIAAATLIKMLPIIFLIYFLIRDRRTFVYSIASFAILLTLAQVLYWPQMGYGYFPFMVKAAVGQTHALGWHENLSIKNMVVKAFTGWKLAAPGYFAPIEGERLLVANALGHLLQIAGVLWMAWALMKFQNRSAEGRTSDALWGWSLISVMMLILSPVTAFEYMVLSLIAFSFVLVFLMHRYDFHADQTAWLCFAGATLLVANILPRQVINRLFPIAALNRLTGNVHLTLSEGYQHYGFPLLGLFLLLAALWVIRPQPLSQHVEELSA